MASDAAPLRVMLSSTFRDLEPHREAVIRALSGKSFVVSMEGGLPKTSDVIDSSLYMVDQASAFVCILGRSYGQTPACERRNPLGLSLTELEFNRALERNLPILLFLMGEKHRRQTNGVETDEVKREKLDSFKARAKLANGSSVERVYGVFDSLAEFERKAIHALDDLRRDFEQGRLSPAAKAPPRQVNHLVPTPPALYAEPRYGGSHTFVGRESELDVLCDWASSADPHPVLLFDAIGGTGKSMLTWEWIDRHATRVRADWAGRFWYSFYERGAVMADFCRCALAYMTRVPFESLGKTKPRELADRLLEQLQARPWLLVLDGLERVLVNYNRVDAAALRDEQANEAADPIAQRDPCSAIRTEDDELLRAMATVSPSKLLITSRLMPRVLHNASGTAIPGVLRVSLRGLRPADAEALFRSCGITGDSQAMQNYLKSQIDCHPLVTGILAGLIQHYRPDRGNFDAWLHAADGGGRLNLGELDLTERRNHILTTAIGGLSQKSRELLCLLALLSEGADYAMLTALNPHLPVEVEEPAPVADPPLSLVSAAWRRCLKAFGRLSAKDRVQLERQKEDEVARAARDSALRIAPELLESTVRDLESRGLLQYDSTSKRYDLHPVVRGVAGGQLRPEETTGYTQRVVDFCAMQTQCPFEEAESLEDVRFGLQIVRAHLTAKRYQEAADELNGGLSYALQYNLRAHAQITSLLRPFFPKGWGTLPSTVLESTACRLANQAGACLLGVDLEGSLQAHGLDLAGRLKQEDWRNAITSMANLSVVLSEQNHLADSSRYSGYCIDLADAFDSEESIFLARFVRFTSLALEGQWIEASGMWDLLSAMDRHLSRAIYRQGDAERAHADYSFMRGTLTEDELAKAEDLARRGKNRSALHLLHQLRGEWHLERREWALAAESLRESVSMGRLEGEIDAEAEAGLLLAQCHLGQVVDPSCEAAALTKTDRPLRLLAEVWLVLGEKERAEKEALAAYAWAWADGAPYVRRYELEKAADLLARLGQPVPLLEPYDPGRARRFPWEEEVELAIERLCDAVEAEAPESAPET